VRITASGLIPGVKNSSGSASRQAAWIASPYADPNSTRAPILARPVTDGMFRRGRSGVLKQCRRDRTIECASLPGWSLWGSLKLSEAVWTIQADDVAHARRALRDARVAADRVGPGRNDYWEGFGPANVDAHEIAVALEAGDPVEALRVADRLNVEELPHPERRARPPIDVAQAHCIRRDDGPAVALLEAERHANELVRYNVQAREMIGTLLHREPKSRTPQLRGLAERMAVTV
jgi:hypothetical protein